MIKQCGRKDGDMFVFWKEKLVFFVVLKIGIILFEGVLVLCVLLVFCDLLILKYMLIYWYQWFVYFYLEKGGEMDFEIFVVVCYFVDWLSSWFCYCCCDVLVGYQNSICGVLFDDFVEEYCKGKFVFFVYVGLQVKFLLFKDG